MNFTNGIILFRFYFLGGFVPRDPTLDGPFFESKYNNIYQPNNNAEMPAEQVSLPSITEPPKLVESGNLY